MNFLALFPNHLSALAMLTDEQAGKVIKAAADYFNGKPIEKYMTDPAVFSFIAATNLLGSIDRGNQIYKEQEKKRTKRKEKEITHNTEHKNTEHITQNTKIKKENFIKEKKNDDGTQGNNGNGLPADNPMARARVLS